MHTLILRTRNRNKWLKQTLNSYADSNHEGIIHIEDDSTESIFQKNKILIESYKKTLTIEHFKGSGSQEKTRSKRVLVTTRNSLKRVKTKYYSFQSDDDLYFSNFSKKAIEFLEDNEDYSCVLGPEIKIYYDCNGNIIKTQNKYWHGCDYDDPLDRIFDYTVNPTLAYYGVCRTNMVTNLDKVENKTLRTCFGRDGVVDFEYYDEELPWCMLVYASGKILYTSDSIMGVRGIHDSEDRVEMAYKNKNDKGYYLGSIFPLSQPTGWKGIKDSHEDISMLIKICGTKYTDSTIDDSVIRVVWSLVKRFSGAGLLNPDTDFYRRHVEDKNKPFYYALLRRISFSSNLRCKRLKTVIASIFSSDLKTFLKNKKKSKLH